MKTFGERSPRVVGILSILGIAAGMALAFSIPKFEELRGVYTVYADLEDAAGVQAGNEVRVAGVRVGRVTGVELRPRAARVQMEIESDVQLPVETRAEIKLKTLLGQKFIDLQLPRTYLLAGSNGGNPITATEGFLSDGDVIPRSQTRLPFEIYQAATAGTETLEAIDKRALRELIEVLGGTTGRIDAEVDRALGAIETAGDVLDDKGPAISELLRNLEDVTGVLAERDEDLQTLLGRGADVLGVLARQRRDISALLAATDDLGGKLGVLIRTVRAPIEVGTTDLIRILALVEEEIDTLGVALEELPTAQEMFARPTKFGRFVEGHVCAVTSQETCDPDGEPAEPGLPAHGTQPSPSPGSP